MKDMKEWKPSSELSEDILSSTDIVFHAGNTRESHEASELLDKTDIHFRVVRDDSIKIPFLAWGEGSAEESLRGEADEGLVYEGIKKIKHFINTQSKIDQIFNKNHPELDGQGNPAFGNWIKKMEERQKKENREIIYGNGIPGEK